MSDLGLERQGMREVQRVQHFGCLLWRVRFQNKQEGGISDSHINSRLSHLNSLGMLGAMDGTSVQNQ